MRETITQRSLAPAIDERKACAFGPEAVPEVAIATRGAGSTGSAGMPDAPRDETSSYSARTPREPLVPPRTPMVPPHGLKPRSPAAPEDSLQDGGEGRGVTAHEDLNLLRKLDALREEMRQYKREQAEILYDLQLLQAEHHESEQEALRQESELREARRQAETTRRAEESLRAESEDLRVQLARLENECERQQDQLARSRADAARLQRELASAISDRDAKASMADSLRQQVGRLEQQHVELEHGLRAAQDEAEFLRYSLDRTVSTQNQTRTRIEEERDALRAEVDDLRRRLDSQMSTAANTILEWKQRAQQAEARLREAQGGGSPQIV